MMKTVSWNCKGLRGSSKVEALKDIVKTKKVNILLIQETKNFESGDYGTLALLEKLPWEIHKL